MTAALSACALPPCRAVWDFSIQWAFYQVVARAGAHEGFSR